MPVNTLAANAGFGTSITLLGDLDGDETAAELAVGAQEHDSVSGSVWIVWVGPVDGKATQLLQLTSGVNGLPTIDAAARFGWSVAALDSPSWLLVGASHDGFGYWYGAAYVVSLDTSGAATSVTKLSSNANGFTEAIQSADNFGRSATCLGDMDGSGQGVHVAVGAIGRDYSGDANAGAVFVMRLRASDGQASDVVEIGDGRGGLPAGTVQSSSKFGCETAFLGELDHSGWPVLLVGAWADDTEEGDAGAAYMLWLDRSAGTVQQHVKLANGLSGMPVDLGGTNAHFGYRLGPLGYPDGSSGVGAFMDRKSATLVRLRRPKRPAVLLTATSVSPSTGLSMTGGGQVLVEGIAPPLTANRTDWLASPVPDESFVIDGVNFTAAELADGTVATFIVPKSWQQSLDVPLVVSTPTRTLHYEPTLGYAAPPTALERLSLWGTGSAASGRFGASLTRAGDPDGDGCSRDLFIGTPGHDTPAIDGGLVARPASGGLLLQSQSCNSPNASTSNSTLLIDGRQLQELPAGAELGSSVAWLGSATPHVGLRRTFIAAGTPGTHSHNGSVLVLSVSFDSGDGSGDGGWNVNVLSKLSPANVTSHSLALTGSRLGASLALANAVGESTATLLTGAPAASGGRGGVLVADVAVSTGQLLSDPVWVSSGELLSPDDAFGSAVAWTHTAGIGTSDSLQLMVGAPGDDSVGTDSGCVHLLTLRAESRAVATWQRLTNELAHIGPSYRFGASLAWLGDIDGDGLHEEVLVGAPGASATVVAWLRSSDNRTSAYGGRWLMAGWPGMPSSLPESFGAAVAAVGDWNDDAVASDLLIGASLANGGNGSVTHARFAAIGNGGSPWGNGVQLTVSSVLPQSALPFDQPTLIRINGTALYEWDPLAQNSRLAHPPEVLISGLDPRGCEVEEVSFDGQTFTCWLSPSLEPNRTLRVKAGQAVSATGLDVSYEFQGSVQAVDNQSPLLQSGGEARTFTGLGLLGMDAFARDELQAAGVGQLLIGSEYSCPLSSMAFSSDGSWVRCESMPAGVGGPHPVRLQLPGGIESDSIVSVTFAPPVVAGIDPKEFELNTSAVYSLSVLGSSFGFGTDDITRLTIGGNECMDIQWKSPTQVDCKHVSGDFGNHDVVIWVASWISSGGEQLVQYDNPPQIVAMDKTVIATIGNDTLQCLAFQLQEYADIIDKVFVGSQPCLEWSLASQWAVDCVTPPGTGASHFVTVTTTTGYSTQSTTTVSYAAPVLVSSSPAVAFADANLLYNFTISGSGFGVVDKGQVEAVLVGGRSCASVKHVNDSTIACSGAGGPWTAAAGVAVTISGQMAVSHTLITFQEPPEVTSISPMELPTVGGAVVILGSGFGAEAADVYFVSVGSRPCLGIDVNFAGTRISCQAPPGVGRDVAIVVSVKRNGASEPATLLSYEPPAIGEVEADTALFAGTATSELQLAVTNCGDDASAVTAWLSSSVESPAWRVECMELVRLDGGADGADQLAQLECRGVSLDAFPDGTESMFMTVSVGNQTSASASISVVGRPRVDLLIPASGTATAGTGSAAEVQVQGANFGFEAADVVEVTVGGRPCPVVQWEDESSLRIAVPPGVGAHQVVRVTTRGGRSNQGSVGISYKQAEVTEIDPSYALTGSGNASFNITGTDFGNQASDLTEIHVGGQRCTRAVWHSPTWVECLGASRSVWPSRSATVTVGGQQGLLNSYFDAVEEPSIDVIAPEVADVGESILLLGSAFGYQQADVLQVTVDGLHCSSILHRGPTAISCVMPEPLNTTRQAFEVDPTVLRNLPVVVTTAGGMQSEPASVSYSGSGRPLTEAPTHLMAWRDVGDAGSFNIRWAYPSDASMPDADDVESFDVRLLELITGDARRTIRVDVASLITSHEVKSTSDGMRVFVYSDVVTSETPFQLDLRAVNPTGVGPWSMATPPVPANCDRDSFLQTHVDVADWQCGVCPVGAYCGGAEAANVTALPGFWRVPWSRSGLGFSRCPRKESCRGYLQEPAAAQAPSEKEAEARRLAASDEAAIENEPARPRGSRRWSATDASPRRDRMTEAGLVAAHWPSLPRKGHPVHFGRSLAEEEHASLNDTLAGDEVPTAVDMRLWGDPAAMERCEEGYHGTMCTSCRSGYTRWGSYGCRQCKSVAMVGLAMAGLAVLMFLIISYLIVSAIKSGAEKTPVGTAAIKVAFSHIQTVAIAASFNLEWPDSVLSLFAGMSTATSVSSEVLSLDCVMPIDDDEASAGGGQARFFDKAAIVLAMPLLMVAVASLVWLLMSACDRSKPEQEAKPAQAGASQSAGTGFMRQNPMAANRRAQKPPGPKPPRPGRSSPGGAEPSLDDAGAVVAPSTPRSGSGLLAGLRRRVTIDPNHLGVNLSLGDKLLTSAVVMLFLVHMSVTTTSLQLLTCRDVAAPVETDVLLAPAPVNAAATGLAAATSGGCDADQTHRRLVQDLEVCCYDSSALRKMFGLGIPGLLVYAFGIPIASALLLRRRRESLHTLHTKTTLGFLYAGFRQRAYYWESVVMLRKVLVAVIAVSLEPMGVTLQTYTTLVVIFFLTALHARIWPYGRTVLNRLELGSLITAFMTFECGLFLTDPATSRPVRISATLAIFFFNAMFLTASLSIILWDKLGIRSLRQRQLQTATSAPKLPAMDSGSCRLATDPPPEAHLVDQPHHRQPTV